MPLLERAGLVVAFRQAADEVDLAAVVRPPAALEDEIEQPWGQATPVLADHGGIGHHARVATLQERPVSAAGFEDESLAGVGAQVDVVAAAVATAEMPSGEIGQKPQRPRGHCGCVPRREANEIAAGERDRVPLSRLCQLVAPTATRCSLTPWV